MADTASRPNQNPATDEASESAAGEEDPGAAIDLQATGPDGKSVSRTAGTGEGPCPACGGSGIVEGKGTCWSCNGTGTVNAGVA